MSEKDKFEAYFREVQPKFSRFYFHILSQAGLTLPQYALLNQLALAGTMSMTEAGERLHISKPAVTNLVDRLEKNKFLKRLAHPKDRRVYLLEIQPEGKTIARKIQTQALNLLLRSLGSFSEGEQKTISRFYAELSKTISVTLMRLKGNGR